MRVVTPISIDHPLLTPHASDWGMVDTRGAKVGKKVYDSSSSSSGGKAKVKIYNCKGGVKQGLLVVFNYLKDRKCFPEHLLFLSMYLSGPV